MSTSTPRRWSDDDLEEFFTGYANRAVPHRDPREVAEAAMRSRGGRSGLLAVPVVLALVVGLVLATGQLGQRPSGEGSTVAQIQVGGTVYYAAPGAPIRIPEQALKLAGTVDTSADSATNAMDYVSGTDVYSLPGVDAASALVMPASPGQQDIEGNPVEYVLLLGPEPLTGAFCRYVDLGRPGPPTVCLPQGESE